MNYHNLMLLQSFTYCFPFSVFLRQNARMVPYVFVLHDYYDSSDLLKSAVFLLKITLFPTNGVKGITSIGRTSIETIFSPHTILRNARPRSQESARTRVRIHPGVSSRTVPSTSRSRSSGNLNR